jgi:hypothetical protein
MSDKYRRDGTPYPEGEEGILEWAKDMENPDYKIVKQEVLPNGKWVSTVWLGLDHNFGIGIPLIFETMVFAGKPKSQGGEDWAEIDMARYSTEKEALKGHIKMAKKWSK